ncbi:MAG: GNAT family N-acetyltransferase [Acidobacteria bacterium]|nr:GNAT family N-acetyltransferase [Acidobacteriota bacterium]
MKQVRLVQINRSGDAAEAIGPLPELVAQACAQTASLYRAVGFATPWVGYVVVSGPTIIGTCGFKAPPLSGKVEIAYFTLPEFEGRGFATAMACELVRVARAVQADITVTAQTLPKPNASNAILKKLGFKFVGTVMHPEDGEVWEWHLAGVSAGA